MIRYIEWSVTKVHSRENPAPRPHRTKNQQDDPVQDVSPLYPPRSGKSRRAQRRTSHTVLIHSVTVTTYEYYTQDKARLSLRRVRTSPDNEYNLDCVHEILRKMYRMHTELSHTFFFGCFRESQSTCDA